MKEEWLIYGKPVAKLIKIMHEAGGDVETYIAQKEVAYQKIVKAYEDAGQIAPPRTILSGIDK